MSKKHGKISLAFIGFLLALLTIVSFAEPPEAPNQLITENPYKEVKTVEANKNREQAEMNISVNKLNPKSLDAFLWDTGELLLYLPKESNNKNKQIDNNIFYLTNSIDKFPDISTVNGKKYFRNFNKFLNKSVDSSNGIHLDKTEDFILINTKTNEKLYLGLLDQKTGNLINVWDIKTQKVKENIRNIDGIVDKINKKITFDTNVIYKNYGIRITDENIFYTKEHLDSGKTITKVIIPSEVKSDYKVENNKFVYEYSDDTIVGVDFYLFDSDKRKLERLKYGLSVDERFYKSIQDMTNQRESNNILHDNYWNEYDTGMEVYYSETYTESQAGWIYANLKINPQEIVDKDFDVLPQSYGGYLKIKNIANNTRAARFIKNAAYVIPKRYISATRFVMKSYDMLKAN